MNYFSRSINPERDREQKNACIPKCCTHSSARLNVLLAIRCDATFFYYLLPFMYALQEIGEDLLSIWMINCDSDRMINYC
jgi:hypothetical protein